MKRRGFGKGLVGGAGITLKENLEYGLRYGVKHLTAQVRQPANHAGWDLNDLKRIRKASQIGARIITYHRIQALIQSVNSEVQA
jgi:hypothetical protein